MDGLMMDFPLTLTHLLRRAEQFFGSGEIVTRLPDKSFHRYTYADSCRRSRALAVALQNLGLERGDRVATLCWNHYQHHEAYLGIPCGGSVLHTLNLRLHPSDLAYIATHGGDRAVIVDRSLKPLLDQFVGDTKIEHVIVVEDDYEGFLSAADPDDWRDPELDPRSAAASDLELLLVKRVLEGAPVLDGLGGPEAGETLDDLRAAGILLGAPSRA